MAPSIFVISINHNSNFYVQHIPSPRLLFGWFLQEITQYSVNWVWVRLSWVLWGSSNAQPHPDSEGSIPSYFPSQCLFQGVSYIGIFFVFIYINIYIGIRYNYCIVFICIYNFLFHFCNEFLTVDLDIGNWCRFCSFLVFISFQTISQYKNLMFPPPARSWV